MTAVMPMRWKMCAQHKRLNLNDDDPKHTPATCYSCKSSNNPGLWDEMGMEAYDKMSFMEIGAHIDEPIGCANCHEAGTMRLIVTNPALDEALKAPGQGLDHLHPPGNAHGCLCQLPRGILFQRRWQIPDLPVGKWHKNRPDHFRTMKKSGFKDWEYPETDTPMLKAQHPEFEFFTAGHTHYKAGVSCADCHMPYARDGASKIFIARCSQPTAQPRSSLWSMPYRYRICGQPCELYPGQVADYQANTEDAIIDAINAIKAAAAAGECRCGPA